MDNSGESLGMFVNYLDGKTRKKMILIMKRSFLFIVPELYIVY